MIQKKQVLAKTFLITLYITCEQVSAEDFGLSADIDSTALYNDNIYRVTDDLAIKDKALVITPKVSALGSFGKHRLELSYDGEYSKFKKESDADYSDHKLVANLNLEHTLRLSSRIQGSFIKEHEDPGMINRIQLDMTEFNKYDQKQILFGLAYGREDATGRIKFTYRKTDKEFTNNNFQYRSYLSDEFNPRFIYKITHSLTTYLDADITNYDYIDLENFSLDNDHQRYSTGINYTITEKLEAEINIGYQKRDYKQEDIRDISGIAYQGEVIWSPNTYTEASLQFKRESIDSSIVDLGGFLRKSYDLEIKHELTERNRIKAVLTYSSDDLVLSEPRNDETYSLKLAVSHELSRKMTLNAKYEYVERSSTLEYAEYKNNVIGISLEIFMED